MYVQLITALLTVMGESMKMLPDYEQRKIEKFHKLRTEYENEVKKPYEFRNDELVAHLASELRRYGEDFAKILAASVPSRVQ